MDHPSIDSFARYQLKRLREWLRQIGFTVDPKVLSHFYLQSQDVKVVRDKTAGQKHLYSCSYICFHCHTSPENKTKIIKSGRSNQKTQRHRCPHVCGQIGTNHFHKKLISARCQLNKPDQTLPLSDHPHIDICGIVYDPMDADKPTINKWIDFLETNYNVDIQPCRDIKAESSDESDSEDDEEDDDAQTEDEREQHHQQRRQVAYIQPYRYNIQQPPKPHAPTSDPPKSLRNGHVDSYRNHNNVGHHNHNHHHNHNGHQMPNRFHISQNENENGDDYRIRSAAENNALLQSLKHTKQQHEQKMADQLDALHTEYQTQINALLNALRVTQSKVIKEGNQMARQYDSEMVEVNAVIELNERLKQEVEKMKAAKKERERALRHKTDTLDAKIKQYEAKIQKIREDEIAFQIQPFTLTQTYNIHPISINLKKRPKHLLKTANTANPSNTSNHNRKKRRNRHNDERNDSGKEEKSEEEQCGEVIRNGHTSTDNTDCKQTETGSANNETMENTENESSANDKTEVSESANSDQDQQDNEREEKQQDEEEEKKKKEKEKQPQQEAETTEKTKSKSNETSDEDSLSLQLPNLNAFDVPTNTERPSRKNPPKEGTISTRTRSKSRSSSPTKGKPSMSPKSSKSANKRKRKRSNVDEESEETNSSPPANQQKSPKPRPASKRRRL